MEREGEVGSQIRATVQSEQHRTGEEQIPTIAHHQPHREQRGPPDHVEAGAVPAETLSLWRWLSVQDHPLTEAAHPITSARNKRMSSSSARVAQKEPRREELM